MIKTHFDTDANVHSFLSALHFDEVVLDGEAVSHRQYLELSQLFPHKRILDVSIIKKLRMIKDNYEISEMKKSASLNYAGYCHIRNMLKEGITEKEVAWEFEKFTREKGASQMAFPPIIAFGAHTSLPHHRSSNAKWKRKDPVLIDVGVVLNGYMSDLTRSFILEPDPEYGKMEYFVQTAFQEALTHCKPGVKVHKLDEVVREYFRAHQVEEQFKHSLGHSLGLEIHEYPTLSHKEREATLAENMVITIEPGLYFDGRFGYRHEDMIYITKQGYKFIRDLNENRDWTR